MRRDGLGLLNIQPHCQGACRIRLDYNGGPEYILCRMASLVTLIGLAIYGWGRRRLIFGRG